MVLVHQWRQRAEAPDVDEQIVQTLRRWRPLYVAIEHKPTVQRLTRQGWPVRELKPERDKVSRATTASVLMEAGQVFFPDAGAMEVLGAVDGSAVVGAAGAVPVAGWLGELERELETFPVGAHDDQVDALAYAAEEASNPHLWAPVISTFDSRPVIEGGHVERLEQAPKSWPRWLYISHGTYSAALLLAVDGEGRYHVVDEVFGSGLQVEQVVAGVREMLQRHGRRPETLRGRRIRPDLDQFKARGERTTAQRFSAAGLSVSGWLDAGEDAELARIDELRGLAAQGQLLVAARCTQTLHELRTWRHKVRAADRQADPRSRFDGPDHAMRCLLGWLASKPAFRQAPAVIKDTAAY